MTTLNQPAAGAPVRALLGTKLGMTQIWDENGVLRPVTVVRVDTNVVTQVRTIETDGYEAVQLAFGDIDARKVTKPLAGHFAKAGVAPRRHVAEIRTPLTGGLVLGQELDAGIFEHIPQAGFCDLPRGVFARIVPEKNLRGFPLTGYRCAVDSPERYAEAQRAVADGEAFGDLRFEDPQSGDLLSEDHESGDPKKGKF